MLTCYRGTDGHTVYIKKEGVEAMAELFIEHWDNIKD